MCMPHVKVYTCQEQPAGTLAYVLLTSANLSKAAWGEFQKNNTQLFMRSYELGVLLLPEPGETFRPMQELLELRRQGQSPPAGTTWMPLPFDLPAMRYGPDDSIWVWDAPDDRPDIFGQPFRPDE